MLLGLGGLLVVVGQHDEVEAGLGRSAGQHVDAQLAVVAALGVQVKGAHQVWPGAIGQARQAQPMQVPGRGQQEQAQGQGQAAPPTPPAQDAAWDDPAGWPVAAANCRRCSRA